MQRTFNMLDVTIIALWFMLREIEIAAAKLLHLTLDDNAVSLMVPTSKMDTTGSWTTRTLKPYVHGMPPIAISAVYGFMLHLGTPRTSPWFPELMAGS